MKCTKNDVSFETPFEFQNLTTGHTALDFREFKLSEKEPMPNGISSAGILIIRSFEKAQQAEGRRDGYLQGMCCLLVPRMLGLSLLLFLEWL